MVKWADRLYRLENELSDMKYLLVLTGVLVLVLIGNTSVTRATQFDVAVLQALDKVTARVSLLHAPVGATIKFGTLEIIVRSCDKRPPEETPESAAFIDVWDVRPGELITSVYRGWMFASSPALAAMEHPVYDVWVLDCTDSHSVSPD
ncbi:DUF2155 domain-containing protein [Gammaproteobacteria bacterium]|nr:DUF2155 domain-containing protein [Gammaproteobacteria bacterium]